MLPSPLAFCKCFNCSTSWVIKHIKCLCHGSWAPAELPEGWGRNGSRRASLAAPSRACMLLPQRLKALTVRLGWFQTQNHPVFVFSPVSLSAVAHSRQLHQTLSSTSELLFSGPAWAWQPHTGTGSLLHNSSISRGSWRAAMPALPLPDSLRAPRTVWLHPTRNCLESRVLSNSISDATAYTLPWQPFALQNF